MPGSSLDWPLSKEEQKRQVLSLYDKDVQAANRLLHSGEAALQALRAELRAALACRTEPGRGQHASSPPLLAAGLAAPVTDAPVARRQPKESTESSLDMVEGVASSSCKSVASCPADMEAAALPPGSAELPSTREAADALEAVERLQLAIVDAAAAVATLLGTASLSGVWGTGAAEPCGSAATRCRKQEDIMAEVRQRARSEGVERSTGAPGILLGGLAKERRRRSRGGDLRVAFAACTEVQGYGDEPDPGPPDPADLDRQQVQASPAFRGRAMGPRCGPVILGSTPAAGKLARQAHARPAVEETQRSAFKIRPSLGPSPTALPSRASADSAPGVALHRARAAAPAVSAAAAAAAPSCAMDFI